MRSSIRVIRSSGKYLWMSLFLLVLGMIIGMVFSDDIGRLIEEQMESLRRMAERINEKNSLAYMFWTILKNNVLVAMMMIGLGVLFGVMPFFGLLSNGMMIGYVMQSFGAAGHNPLTLLAVGILPHGIFEIFAICLAAALGLRLGMSSLAFVIGLFRSSLRSEAKRRFTRILNELPAGVLTVIGLLVVASVVEVTVTPLLMHWILGDVQVDLFSFLYSVMHV